MTQINMHEAKTNFSQVVERALDGEDIVISRYGKPLLRLVPVATTGKRRPIGLNLLGLREDIDWFEPMDANELNALYNNPIEPVVTTKTNTRRKPKP